MADYIRTVRELVGHTPLILVFAGGTVEDQNGRVLLQRRGDHDTEIWGFPGGAVEIGESLDEAATREIYEETGLKVEVTGLIGIYSKYLHTYPNGDVAQPISVFFRCRAVGGELKADGTETLVLEYFDLTELPPLLNQQHEDVAADLRAGQAAVWR